VPEARLACLTHWRQLPKRLRDAIWDAYVPDQEITKTPSSAYLVAVIDCIHCWNRRDGYS
jgi:hypothetical protein